MDQRADVFASRSAKMIVSRCVSNQVVHTHRPAELVVALDGPIDLITGDGGRQKSACYLVPPMYAHSLAAYDGRLARMYVDTGYRRFSAWKGVGIRSTFDDARELIASISSFYGSCRNSDQAAALITAWRESWLPSDNQIPACDPRVIRVLGYLDDLESDVHCDRHSLAASVSLSPSRFAALFAAETGMSLSRYLIWRRVKAALTLVCAGKSVTNAALEAGFTDGAHLTRCCRATYGCTPSSAAGRSVMRVGDALHPIASERLCLEPPLKSTLG